MSKEMQELLNLKNSLLAKGDSLKKAGDYEGLLKVNDELDEVNKKIDALSKFEQAELEQKILTEGTEVKDVTTEKKPFNSLGEQLKAIYNAARGNIDERLKVVNTAQGWNTGTPTGGGYAIQTDFVVAINDRIRELSTEQGILNRIKSITISSNSNKLELVYVDDTAVGVAAGGVIAYWTKEADTITKSHPKLTKTSIELSKLTALSYATEEQLEDFEATSQLFIDSFAEAFVQAEIKGLISGTGLDEPKGFMSSDSLVKVNRKTAGTFSAEDVLEMAAHTIPKFESQYVWMIHPDLKTLLPLMNIKGTGDTISHLVYMPAGGLSGNQYDTLLGKPILYTEYSSAIGTLGDVNLVTLNEMVKIVKGGLRLDESIHVEFLTDQKAFRAIKRENFAPKRDKKIKLVNSNVYRSAFISLDVPATSSSGGTQTQSK